MKITSILSVPLGVAPNGSQFKSNPIVAAGALSGGASLLGGLMSGLFGSSAQNSANETNIAMNRENNLFNASQAAVARNWQSSENEKSRAFSLDQYLREIDWQKYLLGYSTPEEQLKRYRDAGINPYFAMGNISSGVLQSNPTATSPSSNSATPASSSGLPQVKAYDPTNAIMSASHGVSDAINSYFRNENVAQDTRSKIIENMTKLDEQKARIAELLSRKDLNDETRKKYQSEIETINAERELQLENLRRQNTLLRENAHNVSEDTRLKAVQKESVQLQNEWQHVENLWQEKFKPFQLRQLQSIIAENFTQANLNSEQAAIQSAIGTYYKWLGAAERMGFHHSQLDYGIKRSTKQFIIGAAKYQFKMQKYGYDTRYVGTVGDIIGTLGGAAATFIPAAAGAKYLGLFGKGKGRPIGFTNYGGK